MCDQCDSLEERIKELEKRARHTGKMMCALSGNKHVFIEPTFLAHKNTTEFFCEICGAMGLKDKDGQPH